MIDVYIIGCKGIPAKYGGFETFVEELTKGKKDKNIKYHVSCMEADERHFEYNDADCFNVKLPVKGPLGRILHVSRALRHVEKNISHSNKTIVYVLGCRIGPLMHKHYKRLKRLGALVYVNPDGLEWKRDKWNFFEKKILKYCEKCLVKNSDLAICDSKNIEKYIQNEYGKQIKTTYIAYGSYLENSTCQEETYEKWSTQNKISSNGYYLIVGRFVPENNYETMIREFMNSATKKDLVIITNIEHNKFYKYLLSSTRFSQDNRIKFVGTVYDQSLLKKIRENAYGYIHGHEVGGTNPSLLEALGSTKINLLFDVGFNREVGLDGALYWDKKASSLASLIDRCDSLKINEIMEFGNRAKEIIEESFSWDKIVFLYENVFTKGKSN